MYYNKWLFLLIKHGEHENQQSFFMDNVIILKIYIY